MGLSPARAEVPFSNLDALYMRLLESCPHAALQILGVVLAGITRISHVESLLSLQLGDVTLALAPLNSIIDINKYDYISLSHASFGDFLADMTRSSLFYINILAVREDIISTCVSMVMNPKLIVNNTFDNYLGAIIDGILRNTPLTEKIRESLMQLSLPHIWSICEFEPCGAQQSQHRRPSWRSNFINIFLNAINPVWRKPKDNMQPSECEKEFQIIRQFHLSAFQPIFESEFNKYYRETELMHLAVLVTIVDEKSLRFDVLPHFSMAVQGLLQFSESSLWIDECIFSMATLNRHIHHYFQRLWTPIPDDLYAQTALKMLIGLCNYSPHYIRFRSHSVNQKKAISHRHGTIYPKPSHTPHLPQTLRLQRAKRHQYGVKLCTPEDGICYPYASPFTICQVGFILLPECLRRSSKSSELAEFIRSNGKKIPFIPKLTHEAIRAMHEYLARTQEDDSMDTSK
ncbi:hypothetical protein BDN70DRAFT_999016 [Pholiota conissans]|uniref:Uncharacterized protein n=1 Tax=Pholiota conissans TaxID=109636 RepID=A0A9P5YM87_9AGAR|nr:hypothetical protein BDN70DRAFT_999016 [Pholiota conissans]